MTSPRFGLSLSTPNLNGRGSQLVAFRRSRAWHPSITANYRLRSTTTRSGNIPRSDEHREPDARRWTSTARERIPIGSVPHVSDATNNSNNAQADYWTNEGGPSWVRHERRYERMLQPFDDALIGALRPVSGDRILEIGCGFGATSIALAASGAAVHGVDIAPPMIGRARERVQGTAEQITFAVADAQEVDLGGPYDTAVSRFGVMFFADPVRAFTNIAASVRSGGNLAFVCWQSLDRNPWLGLPIEVLRSFTGAPAGPAALAPGAPNPLAFADPAHTEDILRRSGWTCIEFEPVEPLLSIGGDDGINGAVELALNGSSVKALLEGDNGTLRAQVADALTERFAEFVTGDTVLMQSSAWLVTARRG